MGESSAAPIKVFIFAGQSNMAGADALVDPILKTKDLKDLQRTTIEDDSTRFVFRVGANEGAWETVRGHNTTLYGERLLNGLPYKGHGPEVGFNRALGGKIAIIKYANNYGALENGRSAWVNPGSLWTAWQGFVDRQLAALGEPYVIEGFIWHQGIDDGLLKRSQQDYERDLRQIIADLRAKFGIKPFVLARSVNSPVAGAEFMAPIRSGQVAVGSELHNGWVNVDDSTLINYHHLTAASQLVVGERFADEWETLREPVLTIARVKKSRCYIVTSDRGTSAKIRVRKYPFQGVERILGWEIPYVINKPARK